MHVFGWWEEAVIPGESTHIHRENRVEIPHRKAVAGIRTRNLLAIR